jgi:Protein of unknown function (DUF3253)
VSDDDIAQEIVRQLSRRAADSSICPSEVARALQSDEAAWRALMPQVREVAAALRDDGRLLITRGGIEVPEHELHHGAIRLKRGPDFGA